MVQFSESCNCFVEEKDGNAGFYFSFSTNDGTMTGVNALS